jgi:PKD domain
MPTLKDVAQLLDLSSELKMAAKLHIASPISTIALIKAYEHTPPVARFSAQQVSGSAFVPCTFQFTDQSVGYIKSWKWDFGDTATSTEQNPKHTYTQSSCPTFAAKLTVGNSGGSNSTTQQVDVPPLPPVARFTPNPVSGPAPLTVHFENQTSGECMYIPVWTFGDGGISNDFSPTHTYGSHSTTQAADAIVVLGYANRSGESQASATVHIDPAPPPQTTEPYIYAYIYTPGTIEVDGSKFPPNAPIGILEVDAQGNRSPLYNTQSNQLGTFSVKINVEGCTGGSGNPLTVQATGDNGAHFSNPSTVQC